MQNMFNNNSGSIASVNISQSNKMTNEQFESDKKIRELMLKAQQTAQSATSSVNQKKEANQLMTFASMANEINQKPATNEQKKQFCTSGIDLNGYLFGYEVGLKLKKECPELFPN